MKPSILADALEALLAAVYFDGGWEAADKVVLHLFGDRIHNCSTGPGGSDFKTRLEELAAQRLEQLPRYRVDADGPDHSKHFVASVSIAGKPWGTGEGSSKKQAEQAAAQVALIALNEELSDLSEFEKRKPMPELPEVEVLRRDLEARHNGTTYKNSGSRDSSFGPST